jgi:hypothetical protein
MGVSFLRNVGLMTVAPVRQTPCADLKPHYNDKYKYRYNTSIIALSIVDCRAGLINNDGFFMAAIV